MTGNGSNGGFMYDCLKLEAGDIVTAIDKVGIADNTEPVKVRKIVKNNQLVIETPKGAYNVAGVKQ